MSYFANKCTKPIPYNSLSEVNYKSFPPGGYLATDSLAMFNEFTVLTCIVKVFYLVTLT